MEKRNLPQRFWTTSEYEEGEVKHINVRGMKSKDFKKYYNKIVNPRIKELGFKCSGFKAFKSDDLFYYMINCYINSRGGTCNITFNIHPIGFPSEYNIQWDEEKFQKDHMLHLFKREFCLENNQVWIDVGRNEDEAIETCQLIEKDIVDQQQNFFSQFSNFKEDFFSISPKSFLIESLYKVLRHYGLPSLHGPLAILWLADFHLFYDSTQLAEEFAQLALDTLHADAEKAGTIPNKFVQERIQAVLKKN